MGSTRYADTSDGLSVAYQIDGSGPPNLIWVPGFASHVELFWELPGYAHAYRRLMRFTRLVVFDKRGTGLSDRSLGTGLLEERARDIGAIIDAEGLDTVVLLGTSEGGAMAAWYAATYPERVEALVLMGADVTGGWISQDLPEAVQASWGQGRLLQRLWLNGAGDLAQLSRIERAMGTPRAMGQQLRLSRELDARPVLSAINRPTLVLHCVDDPVVPISAGRQLAGCIPGARLVEIEGHFHGSNRPEEMDLYIDEMEHFLTGRRRGSSDVSQRTLATIMITDIVASTERAVDSGDDRWTTLLKEHERVARQAVSRFDGRWIKSTGDGVLATFAGPAGAIWAARDMQHDLAALDISLRVGIHTGEIELREGDIHGVAVHVAARVLGHARGGQIWVSSTVPGLVAGSDIEFESRGTAELKGLPGSWELWVVRDDPG
jgi:class 3 adenylate cyclase